MTLILAGIAFAIGLFIAFLYPGTCLAAAVCIYALETVLQTRVPFLAQHTALVNYASAAIVMCGIVSAALRGRLSRIQNVEWAIYAFYGLLVASWFWSVSKTWSYSTLTYAAPHTAVYIFLMPFVMKRVRDLEHGIWATILVGTVSLVMLLFATQMSEWGRNYFVESGLVDRYGQEKKGGSPGAVTRLAGEVILILMFLHIPTAKSLFAVARFLPIAIGLAVIIQTDTRGQLIALLPTICLISLFKWPKLQLRTVLSVGFAFTMLAIIVYWASSFSMQTWRWSPDVLVETYSRTRIDFCRAMLTEWISSSPWHIMFGMGAGASWSVIGIYPHVVAVQILCELGIVGLAMFLGIIAYSARVFLRTIKEYGDDDRIRGLCCCLAAIIFYRLVLSCKQGGMTSVYVLFSMQILLCKLGHAVRYSRSKRAKRPRLRPGYLLKPALPSHPTG